MIRSLLRQRRTLGLKQRTKSTDNYRRTRRLHLEPLESRHLLSISPAFWPSPTDVPPLFVENLGQWNNSAVQFVRYGGGGTVALTDSAVLFQVQRTWFVPKFYEFGNGEEPPAPVTSPPVIPTVVYGFSFAGVNTLAPQGWEAAPTVFHYRIGGPESWVAAVPSYCGVFFDDLYSQLDVLFRGEPDGVSMRIEAGSANDLAQFGLQLSGVAAVREGTYGELIIDLPSDLGSLVQPPPRVFQVIDGQELEIPGRYRVVDNLVTVEIAGDYDPTAPLTIEAPWGWWPYFPSDEIPEELPPSDELPPPEDGGNGGDEEGGGDAVVDEDWSGTDDDTSYAGDNSEFTDGHFDGDHSGGPDDPGDIGIFPPFDPWGPTHFLAQLTPDGRLERGAFFQGGWWRGYQGIAFLGDSGLVLTGSTLSALAVPSAVGTTVIDRDAFVVKLGPDGQAEWCVFFGGDEDDAGTAVTVDNEGAIYAGGVSWSVSWTVGGYQTAHAGQADGFLVKLAADGSHLWSTFVGGEAIDSVNALAVDLAGGVVATGQTASPDWVWGGGDTTLNGPTDAFVVKIAADGTHLWSTYLGGDGEEDADLIAVDELGAIWITGYTSQPDWLPDDGIAPPGGDFRALLFGIFSELLNNPPTLTVTRLVDLLPEDTDTSARVKVADFAITDDGLGQFTITLSGPDALLFEVEPTGGQGSFTGALFLRAGTVLDPSTNPVLEVTIEVNDAELNGGPEATYNLVIPVAHVFEGSSVTDWFHFRPLSSGAWLAVVNGKSTVLDPQTAAVVFRGQGGVDNAFIHDAATSDIIEVLPDKVVATYGGGLRLEIYGFENVDFISSAQGEVDTALIRAPREAACVVDILGGHFVLRVPDQMRLRGFNVENIEVHGDGGNENIRLWHLGVPITLTGTLQELHVDVGLDRGDGPIIMSGSGQILPALRHVDIYGAGAVTVWGSVATDRLEIFADAPNLVFAVYGTRGDAVLKTADSRLWLRNFDDFQVTASGEGSRAFLIGTGGQEEFVFWATEATARFTSTGLMVGQTTAVVTGFAQVIAYSSGRGTSEARFFDSPETADRFWGSPRWSAMNAGSLYAKAIGFDSYSASFSGGGGGDVSILYDNAMTADTLEVRPTEARLTFGGNPSRYVYASGHRWLRSYSSGPGSAVDTAEIFLPAGSIQQVRASFVHPQVLAQGEDFYAYVKNFGRVRVNGNWGDNDTARVWDSAGDEHVAADGAINTRLATVTSGLYTLELLDLARVQVVGAEGGDNTRSILNEELLDFVLETVGSWRDV